jgi:hypothetical protein
LSTWDVTKKAQIGGEQLLADALGILGKAKEEGITLRITGGIAIFYLLERYPPMRNIWLKKRRAGSSSAQFADLDLVGYSNETKKLNELFLDKLLFKKDKIINALFGDRRRIYYHPQGTYHVDVLLDKLEFNHDIDIRGRLELDYPQLDLPDLLLTKLQIHYANEKDLLDIIALSATDSWASETALGRVIEILSDDWGFYYDAVNNLKGATEKAPVMIDQSMEPSRLHSCVEKIGSLLDLIERSPKAKNWQKRAKQGTKKQWWRDTEDVLR